MLPCPVPSRPGSYQHLDAAGQVPFRGQSVPLLTVGSLHLAVLGVTLADGSVSVACGVFAPGGWSGRLELSRLGSRCGLAPRGEAQALPLLQVGWIFTDLVSEDTRKGTVRYSRNKVRGAR